MWLSLIIVSSGKIAFWELVIILEYQPCALAYYEEESHTSDWSVLIIALYNKNSIGSTQGWVPEKEKLYFNDILYSPIADEEIATAPFK